MYACVYIYMCMCLCMCIKIDRCIHIHMCVCVHIHTDIHHPQSLNPLASFCMQLQASPELCDRPVAGLRFQITHLISVFLLKHSTFRGVWASYLGLESGFKHIMGEPYTQNCSEPQTLQDP